MNTEYQEEQCFEGIERRCSDCKHASKGDVSGSNLSRDPRCSHVLGVRSRDTTTNKSGPNPNGHVEAAPFNRVGRDHER